MAARKVRVILSIRGISMVGAEFDAARMRESRSPKDSRFPVMAVSKSRVSTSLSAVPSKCWLLTMCSARPSKETWSPSAQAPSSCKLVVAWSDSSLITVALKNGCTSTARERYSSFVLDLDVLSHFFRIFENAVPLISTNC